MEVLMERPTLDKFPTTVLAQIDIQTAFIVSRLIIAAERLQIFRALHSKSMTAETIGRTLGIHELYLKPFLCSPRFPRSAAGDEQEVPKHAFCRDILH